MFTENSLAGLLLRKQPTLSVTETARLYLDKIKESACFQRFLGPNPERAGYLLGCSVGDPKPQDPHVFGPPDQESLVNNPAPDPNLSLFC